ARRHVLHAPALRLACADVSVRRAAGAGHDPGGGRHDADRRVPGLRSLMATPAPVPFSWLRGEVHADVVVGVVLLAAAYTWATVASRRPASLGSPIAFFAGCAALL